MKITRDTISPTKVKLTITLDKLELDDAEKVALHKLAKSVKVPGFRKGKVPASVAAKHIDRNALAAETADNALSKAVATAFSSEDVRALERPQVEVTKFVPGNTLEFTAEAEVIPEIKLGNYKKLKAPKQEKVSIDKAEIDEVIDRIQTQLATKQDVERKAKTGDEAVIDFVGKKDGVPFEGGTGNDYPLTLGSNSFIPGFEDGIVGHKPGETFDLELEFPKEYHAKDLAGQKVTFTTTLKKLVELVKPAADDELAAKAGPFTSFKELEDDIRKELTARKEREAAEELRDGLVKDLVAKSTVPVPEILRKDQLQSIEQDMTQNLMYQGLNFEQWLESKGYKSKDEWIEKEAGDIADTRVQAGLVLAEVSKLEQLTADENAVEARVSQLKEQYKSSPETLKQLDTDEVRRDIANRLVTELAVDKLVELNN